jgi:hypothetical protein
MRIAILFAILPRKRIAFFAKVLHQQLGLKLAVNGKLTQRLKSKVLDKILAILVDCSIFG